jgi:hypothetical protein
VVVLLMLIPLLAPSEAAGSAGLSKIAAALGYAAVKVRGLLDLQNRKFGPYLATIYRNPHSGNAASHAHARFRECKFGED